MPWAIRKATENVAIVYMDSNKLNIMDDTFLNDFEDALNRLESDFPLCSVVFTGNDRAFSAGLSLDKLRSGQHSNPNPFNHPMSWSDIEKAPKRYLSRQPLRTATSDLISLAKYIERVDKLGWRLFKYPRKTIAALNGHAIAGGTLIASACDIRIADGAVAQKSLMGLNEVINGFQIPYRMVVVCTQAFASQQAAKQTILSGKLLNFVQARDPSVGFIHELVGSESNGKGPFSLHNALYPLSSITIEDGTFLSPLLARAVSLAHVDVKCVPAYGVNKAMLNEHAIRLGDEDPLQTFKHLFSMWAYQMPDAKTLGLSVKSSENLDQDEGKTTENQVSAPKKLFGKL